MLDTVNRNWKTPKKRMQAVCGHKDNRESFSVSLCKAVICISAGRRECRSSDDVDRLAASHQQLQKPYRAFTQSDAGVANEEARRWRALHLDEFRIHGYWKPQLTAETLRIRCKCTTYPSRQDTSEFSPLTTSSHVRKPLNFEYLIIKSYCLPKLNENTENSSSSPQNG